MTGAPPAPDFASFRGIHQDASILVCGCGESLNELAAPERCITVGVNDVGRRFDPTYLVVLNGREQFAGDRFSYVEASRARFVFSQLDLPLRHARPVRIRLGSYAGVEAADDVLHYTRNSPYVAVCLAAHMGARRIGLIGVDFTESHFFGRTGRHALAGELSTIDREYGRLHEALSRRGVELVNLGSVSRLASLPRRSLAEWQDASSAAVAREGGGGLRIVSYATTPVAGVPAILGRCIAARTGHVAQCVWARGAYDNGVVFGGGIEWERDPSAAEAAIAAADVLVVHNGKVDPRHEPLVRDKPVITMAHNYRWNVDDRFVRAGMPGAVVAQYQATLPEFADWTAVPNPVPLWEPAYRPESRSAVPTICFTPSGRHERYPAGHRLYWHGKGYHTTLRVLDELASRGLARLEVVRERQLPHADVLAMKRRAHIVIDECVTGSYHRNSLEGLAVGAVVVNGVGLLLPGLAEVLARFTTEPAPFVSSTLDDLRATLLGLLDEGLPALRARGGHGRAWMEAQWSFDRQWLRTWVPLVDAALARRPRTAAVPATPAPTAGALPVAGAAALEERADPVVLRPPVVVASPRRAGMGVSAVVPHGGAERLPQLRACLRGLRLAGVDEVIVVELGAEPRADADVRDLVDRYLFVRHDGAFERARALNVGTAIARCEHVLWQDNDLLHCDAFLERALREARDRRLDYLVPYTSIGYLSEFDSQAVMRGAAAAGACIPVRVLYSGARQPACSGGMGVVAASFVRRYGGFIEGFRGWGGEDNAWMRKVALLGRVATTCRQDQHVFHLHHAGSGGYGMDAPAHTNPHYAANVALLQRVSRSRTAAQLLREFPPPRHSPAPWPAGTVFDYVVNGDPGWRAVSGEVASSLRARFGTNLRERNGTVEPAAAATVYFGAAAAACDPGCEGRAVVVVDEGDEDAINASTTARRVVTVVPQRSAAAGEDGTGALVAALSLVVGRSATAVAATPPVWLYWEGPCPDWIVACRRTIEAHAADVRLLDASAFDALRDRDRDIDLARLTTVQRADFARAFLLARHGGLWIDSDCLVMQPLAPLLDTARVAGFVAHRERSGLASNGFMAAAPASAIAEEYYQRICRVLRSRGPLGWTSLGSEPLTSVLDAAPGRWHELPCEQVQPICWSEPHHFFVRAPDARHEAHLDTRALCYMLSNTQVRQYLSVTPGASLTMDDTFFSFLLRRSLAGVSVRRGALAHAGVHPAAGARPSAAAAPHGDRVRRSAAFHAMVQAYRRYRDESLSGPGSTLVQTATLRRHLPALLSTLGVRALLDAPCGDFNWMQHVSLDGIEYTGVDLLPEIIAANVARHGRPGRTFTTCDLLEEAAPAADCVLSRDFLVHLSFDEAHRALSNLRRSGARYLLATTFPGRRRNADTAGGEWRPLNLELPPFRFPPPDALINEGCTEAGGSFRDKSLGLWRLQELPA